VVPIVGSAEECVGVYGDRAAALSFVIHVPFGRLGAVVCLVLAFTSFLRFCDLRWKAVQQTYWFFIALKLEPAAFSEPALSEHTTARQENPS
jgi:hypothetical protein